MNAHIKTPKAKCPYCNKGLVVKWQPPLFEGSKYNGHFEGRCKTKKCDGNTNMTIDSNGDVKIHQW